jgi:HD-GYP domain-containing protein (c-di-GMP phosphodiesterase class II)
MVVISVIVTGAVLYPLLMALNRQLFDASRRVMRGNIELLEVLGSAIAHRDSDTHSHNYRVTWYSLALAKAAGLSAEKIRSLISGAFLHDVGKIGISDTILLKPGKLTTDEFALMQQHVSIGKGIISKSKWLGDAQNVVENHHEKWDGSGYPKGIKALEIPIEARIFAIADVFDALTSRRPYKEPYSLKVGLKVIREDSGSHFDPQLVSLFVQIADSVYRDVSEQSEDQLAKMLGTTIENIYGL